MAGCRALEFRANDLEVIAANTNHMGDQRLSTIVDGDGVVGDVRADGFEHLDDVFVEEDGLERFLALALELHLVDVASVTAGDVVIHLLTFNTSTRAHGFDRETGQCAEEGFEGLIAVSADMREHILDTSRRDDDLESEIVERHFHSYTCKSSIVLIWG